MPRVSYTTEEKASLLANVAAKYGSSVLTKKQIDDFCTANNLPVPYFIYHDETRKAGHGKYSVAMAGFGKYPAFPKAPKAKAATPAPVAATEVVSEAVPVATAVREVINQMPASIQADISCTVPDKDPTFVPFGNYDDIEAIVSSRMFLPVYVTGMSGNGKTMSIVQSCAKLKREIVRVNVTEETDELDLLGGTELINGNTVNREGPVLLAMRRGAILLIDEGDLNNTKILCLMPILEGKPYFNKKTGEVIRPADGFNIFITGNTKGKGSDDGRFIGTKVMNEAFLERFSVTMEQGYPLPKDEKKIVLKNMIQKNCEDEDFAIKLCTFAEISRKTFYEGAVDEVITTRRLVHVVNAFAIFKDRMKSLTLALNRFDDETKTAFLDLYSKIDGSIAPEMEIPVPSEAAQEAAGADNSTNSTKATHTSTPAANTTTTATITDADKARISNLLTTYLVQKSSANRGSDSEFQVYHDMISRVLATQSSEAGNIGIVRLYNGSIRVYGNSKEIQFPATEIDPYDASYKSILFVVVLRILLGIRTLGNPF